MISFFLTLFRLGQAVQRAWSDPVFRATFILTMLLLASGSIFYHKVEGWSWLDALYFSVATLSTVGYGDLAPVTSAGKIFTVCYIPLGLGVFVTLVSKLAEAALTKRAPEPDRDGA